MKNPTPQLHIGPSKTRVPRPASVAQQHFVELSPQVPFPKPATLAKWRAQLPPTFQVALALPTQDTLPVDTAGTANPNSIARWTAEALEALAASVLVVTTSARFSPTRSHEDQLARYVRAITRPSGCLAAWAPSGLWEEDNAKRAAAAAGALWAFDPLQTLGTLAADGPHYLRVLGVGAQRRLGDGALGALASAISEASGTVFLAVQSAQADKDARRLMQLLADDSRV